MHFIPDGPYIHLQYFLHMKKRLSLSPPRTFNEKIQWLKLHDKQEFYTGVVDKYNVREYVEQRIGKEHLIPLIGLWDNVEEIDFKQLPGSFVLKCTHDSGSVVICKNKDNFDIVSAKKELLECLKQNMYYNGREWPYKNVLPRIIGEELLVDTNTGDLKDYKFMCFNGEPKCIFTGSNRHNGELYITFFDLSWNILPFERHYHSDPNEIIKPKYLAEMIELARVLAKDFTFVRVDFYETNNNIYFGELTLYPGSGFEEFRPEKWDLQMGEWLKLPGEE
jgi:hypothetical protein